MLELLAYFGNQSLWYELFCAALSQNTPQWIHDLVSDDVNFEGAMKALTEFSFLEVHPALGSWSMHNSIHDWAVARFNQEIEEPCYWYAFDCIHSFIEDLDMDSFGHIRFSRLASHARQLVQEQSRQCDTIANSSTTRLDMASRLSMFLRC